MVGAHIFDKPTVQPFVSVDAYRDDRLFKVLIQR